MSDALARVKRDLGKDAVILHTRTLRRGGLFGIGSRSVVEITATADERVSAFRKARRRPDPAAPSPRRRAAVPAPVSRGPVEPASRRWDPPDPAPAAQDTPPGPSPPAAAPDPGLRSEVNEIRSMVRDLLRRTDRADHPAAPAELIDYYTHLVGQDVAEELAVGLLGRVTEKLRQTGGGYWDARGRLVKDTPPDPEAVRAELCEAIREMLPPAAPLALNADGRPTVVALVGPTGVGKTTTLAKLAANMKLREDKSVGLITIDAYRIAAVEQLRTYAQILKVPLVSVLTPDELRAAIARMAGLDLVLIDTAGRSQRDEPRVAELAEFIDAARPDQVHLVLSTTSREETIREAIETFSGVGARHLVFTKLDEAMGCGVILNVLKSVDMRLSYLTHGQAVPDDIEIASARRVARLIVGDARPERRPPSPPAGRGPHSEGHRS